VIVVTYGSPHLEKCCSLSEAAEQEFGPVYADAVLALLADIEAVDEGQSLIDLYGATVTIEPDDSLSVAIGANCFAKFVTVGERVRHDRAGRVIWASVQRLKLTAVVKW